MASYYKTIRGQRYDRSLLELCDSLTAGRGDGRISKADARQIIAAVRDAGKITAIERQTLVYIQEHYRSTAGAAALLRAAIGDPDQNAAPQTARQTKKTQNAAADRAAPQATAPATALFTRQRELFSALFVLVSVMIAFLLCVLLTDWCAWRSTPEAKNEALQEQVDTADNAKDQTLPGSQSRPKSDRQLLEETEIPFSAKNSRNVNSPAQIQQIEYVVSILKRHPDWQIEVQGHTCNQDRSGANQRISETRARLVEQALQRSGIAAKRLSIRGYADTRPAASNDSPAGRRQNRRVGFRVQP
ncbi:MAG: OmpA family protein [Leptospiraceae bacterium]|nr:OmpA family protein [Leptospiraceae bacterium]